MIAVTCGQCGKTFKVREQLAGKRAKCQCLAVLTIPEKAATANTFEADGGSNHALASQRTKTHASAADSTAGNRTRSTPLNVWNSRIKILWTRPKIRLIAISGGIVVAALCVTLLVLSRMAANQRAFTNRQAEENYRLGMKSAEASARAAAEDEARATKLRTEAAQLEGSAPAVQTKDIDSNTTKSAAIEADRSITSLIESHPEMESWIRGYRDPIKAQQLDLALSMLVASGNITPSQVRYVRTFAQTIEFYPD